jgi:hypothetical protein
MIYETRAELLAQRKQFMREWVRIYGYRAPAPGRRFTNALMPETDDTNRNDVFVQTVLLTDKSTLITYPFCTKRAAENLRTNSRYALLEMNARQSLSRYPRLPLAALQLFNHPLYPCQ